MQESNPKKGLEVGIVARLLLSAPKHLVTTDSSVADGNLRMTMLLARRAGTDDFRRLS